MSNERYNPYLNSDPLRVGVYVELKNVFPCIPPELVMRQYTKAFGLSECAPASLIDMLFPSDLAAAVPPECTNEAIYESIKRFKSMRLPPIPRENVRNDLSAIHRAQENQQADEALKKHVGVESMFSFSRLCPSTITSICRVHGSGVFAEGHSPSTSPSTAAEDAQLVVGYDTGAVFMWTLKKYAGYLESLRAEEHKLGILGSQYAPPPIESGVSAKLWGGSRVPEGVELLGYHLSGRVVSSTYDAQAALAITGSAEGSMYVWDVLGRYGTGKRSFVRGEAVASVEFAKAVRTRRLCYIKKGSHDGPVSALAIFSNLCISGGADRTVRTWGRTTSTVPDYVPLQKFHMEGWVRSIEASNSRGVQTEDVMVTDDTGYMIGLKASAINTQQLPSARVRAGASTTGGGSTTGALLSTTNGTNSNTHVPSDTPPLLSPEDKEVVEPLQETAEVKSTTPPLTPQPPQSAPPLTTAAAITSDGWCSFSLGRSHHFFSEEAIRIGPRRIQHKEEFTNTTVRLIPMCNYTHLLSLNYSPVARLMDYSKLRVSLKLPHPSLTVSGAEMSTKSASSVYRKEQERRAGIFKEHAEAQPMGKFEATEKKRSSSLEPLKSEPLRFIDGLYVPHNDVVFLLDNRNTVYVWERETNRFLATVTMSAVNEEGRPKRALALLPTGTKHYTEQYKPGGPRKEQEGRYEEMSIPFFVVCDSGVELYYVVPTANPVLEVPAHKDAILGISFAPIQTSLPIDHHATAATEDVHIVPPCEVDIAMVSASIDGTLFLWGKKLQFLRAYNMHDESPYEEDTKSEAGGSPHEVTSFHYSDRWGVAVTGHDNGDVRFWRCDGELTDVEVCPHIHTNTISAMAEGHAPVNNRSLDDEDVLITVSFDGFMGLWSGPERRRAIYKNKLRVSWNELLCVVYCPTKALYVVGDSAGYIFVISTKDMTPLQVSPPPHHGPSLLSADATISTHSGAIVCACLSGDYIITADDEGHIISWKYFSFQISTECFIHLSGGDDEFSGERAEINCIAAIAHQRFLVGTRGGDIFSFDADVQPSPLRFYRHGCEVRSLAIQINGNSFDFVVGGSDGSITYLNEQFLTPL